MATITTVLTTFPGRPPGDGLCLYFFDPHYEFFPGGIGSSLGYVNYTGPLAHNAEIYGTAASAAQVNPVNGAYLGIGFDVKGDFGNTSDGKPGSAIIKTDLDNISSCPITDINPNTITVRSGTLSSYRVMSTTPNLSTYGASSVTLSAHERYSETPPLTLHQEVTSRDDVIFNSARVTLQNDGKRLKVEIKNPVDGKYYPYQVLDIPSGLGERAVTYTNPTMLRAGISFSTSDSVMNCEIKNFSVQGKMVPYRKVDTYLEPPTGTNYTVFLSGDCP